MPYFPRKTASTPAARAAKAPERAFPGGSGLVCAWRRQRRHPSGLEMTWTSAAAAPAEPCAGGGEASPDLSAGWRCASGRTDAWLGPAIACVITAGPGCPQWLDTFPPECDA